MQSFIEAYNDNLNFSTVYFMESTYYINFIFITDITVITITTLEILESFYDSSKPSKKLVFSILFVILMT